MAIVAQCIEMAKMLSIWLNDQMAAFTMLDLSLFVAKFNMRIQSFQVHNIVSKVQGKFLNESELR
jgi:hypothetical protein